MTWLREWTPKTTLLRFIKRIKIEAIIYIIIEGIFPKSNLSIINWDKPKKLEVERKECPEGFPYPVSHEYLILSASISSRRKGFPWPWINLAILHIWIDIIILMKNE